MPFTVRAEALLKRGEAVRAAVVLSEGIKRNPSNKEALHCFLQIYVEELEQTGLEQSLVQVLDTQPNGDELFSLVCSELKERQQFSRLKFLCRVRNLRINAAR